MVINMPKCIIYGQENRMKMRQAFGHIAIFTSVKMWELSKISRVGYLTWSLELVSTGSRRWQMAWKAGLRSRWILSDSDSSSDSILKILTPTPTPTPLRLRSNKWFSIIKEQCAMVIIHFPFACIQTGNGMIENPLAVTVDETGRSYRCFLWMGSIWVFVLVAVVTKRSRLPQNYLRYP